MSQPENSGNQLPHLDHTDDGVNISIAFIDTFPQFRHMYGRVHVSKPDMNLMRTVFIDDTPMARCAIVSGHCMFALLKGKPGDAR